MDVGLRIHVPAEPLEELKQPRVLMVLARAAVYRDPSGSRLSAFHASQKTNCLRNLLHDFRALDPSVPTSLHIGKVGTLTTAKSQHPTLKSKHREVK